MMRTAERFFFEEMGIEMPKGNVPTSWFNENNLPQLFECSCCGTIATLESAMIDENGLCYCSSCACADDEPADIDSDFGFDPYDGCYTYDC